MLDARFLVDVHYRHGEKEKATFPGAANAEEVSNKPHHKGHSEEWHTEQEHIASSEDNPVAGKT